MSKPTVEVLVKTARYMAANFDSVDCRRLYVEICCAISAETGDSIEFLTTSILVEPIPAIYLEDETDMSEWEWGEEYVKALKTKGETEVTLLITDSELTFTDSAGHQTDYGLEGVDDEYHASIVTVLMCCLKHYGIKLAAVTKMRSPRGHRP